MSGFLDALVAHDFLQRSLAAGLLAALAAGIVGPYVVVRRISVIAGAIAHAVLGGIGAARWLHEVHGWTALRPVHGALAAALLAALAVALISRHFREREDTLIAAVWAFGMALGVLFVSRTPGYARDLMSDLFGNVLLVQPSDLWLMAGLDAVVLAVALVWHRQIVATCFDPEFARLRGINTELVHLLLLLLAAVTVVLLALVVGIVLVIALLTIPAAIAGRLTRTLGGMMALAVVVSAGLTSAGLAVSYGPDLPTGATTIVLAVALYGLVLAAGGLRRLVRG
ncbi:MAG: metal ABC transporter permease [Acidobacteriota bacterium]